MLLSPRPCSYSVLLSPRPCPYSVLLTPRPCPYSVLLTPRPCPYSVLLSPRPCSYRCPSLQVDDNRKFRVHIPGEKMFSSDYQDLRSIFGAVKLNKGRYLIIPTTKAAGAVGDFLVRLYTGSNPGAK